MGPIPHPPGHHHNIDQTIIITRCLLGRNCIQMSRKPFKGVLPVFSTWFIYAKSHFGGVVFSTHSSILIVLPQKASATMLVLLTTLLGMTDVYKVGFHHLVHKISELNIVIDIMAQELNLIAKVIEAVRSPRTGFVNQIRNLALSRLSHAQFAASSLFKCLQVWFPQRMWGVTLQTGPWELFLVSQYTTQDLIRIDLTQHLTVARLLGNSWTPSSCLSLPPRAPTPMGKSKAWQSVTAAFKNPTSTLALSNLPSQLNLEYPVWPTPILPIMSAVSPEFQDLPGRVVQNQLNELAMAPPLLCRLVSEMIIPQVGAVWVFGHMPLLLFVQFAASKK